MNRSFRLTETVFAQKNLGRLIYAIDIYDLRAFKEKLRLKQDVSKPMYGGRC
jgi:hypothetical protein